MKFHPISPSRTCFEAKKNEISVKHFSKETFYIPRNHRILIIDLCAGDLIHQLDTVLDSMKVWSAHHPTLPSQLNGNFSIILSCKNSRKLCKKSHRFWQRLYTDHNFFRALKSLNRNQLWYFQHGSGTQEPRSMSSMAHCWCHGLRISTILLFPIAPSPVMIYRKLVDEYKTKTNAMAIKLWRANHPIMFVFVE